MSFFHHASNTQNLRKRRLEVGHELRTDIVSFQAKDEHENISDIIVLYVRVTMSYNAWDAVDNKYKYPVETHLNHSSANIFFTCYKMKINLPLFGV